MKKIPQRGFIALISAIIISTVLLTLAVSIGSNTFFARFDALNHEYKRLSLGFAESCVTTALGKIGANYNYSASNVLVSLGTLYGKPAECTISQVTAGTPVNGKKPFTIVAKANFNNAFSTITTQVTAQDPAQAPVTPPPTCALNPTALSVPGGSSVAFAWSTAGSGITSFIMDRGVGSLTPYSSGSATFTAPISPGTYTYTATVTNPGGPSACNIILTVTTPPPAPACADTVMMLDRSYSMFGYPNYPSGYNQWIPNEKTAGKTLVDLYSSVASSPKVGFGRIADLVTGHGADLESLLTSNYASVKSDIDNGMPSNPIGYTNLGEAITIAAAELTSVRHTSGKQKVLIFVSDGEPNEPTSGPVSNTGWQSPSATAAPSEWTAPANAYTSNDVRATAGNDDDDQGYRNFNFSVPANATIQGIEVQLEAFSTVSGSGPLTLFSDDFGTGGTDSTFDEAPTWTEGGGGAEKRAAGSGGDSASPNGGRFAVIFNGGWICETVNATGVSTMRLSYNWRGDSDANQSTDDGIVEYQAAVGGASCSSGSGWTTLQNHDLQNDAAWSTQAAFALPSALNNSTFFLRYRANSNTNEYFRVDGVSITGTGAPANTSCQLQARIGDNSTFSSYRSVTLSGTETTFAPLGSASDDWDSVSWSPADFSNGNFKLETRFNKPDASCAASAAASLDHVQARVHYTVPVTPTQYALDAAAAAKGSPNNVSIFSIHFGDAAGQTLMGQLASPSVIPATSISTASRAGGMATITTASAHRLTANQRVQISGVSNAAFNGTVTVVATPTPNTFTYTLSGSTVNATGGSVTPTNLFLSPSSSAMAGIFQSIGVQVCPAAAASCSNGVDDDSDGVKDEADSGCHTDGNAGNPATYDPDDTDEWTTPAAPTPPAPPPPPPTITIGSWVEIP